MRESHLPSGSCLVYKQNCTEKQHGTSEELCHAA